MEQKLAEIVTRIRAAALSALGPWSRRSTQDAWLAGYAEGARDAQQRRGK